MNKIQTDTTSMTKNDTLPKMSNENSCHFFRRSVSVFQVGNEAKLLCRDFKIIYLPSKSKHRWKKNDLHILQKAFTRE